MKISRKRVYDTPEEKDGFRILVDRLWPRGLSKEKAQVDLWYKEIAPSTELRKDFHAEKIQWTEFRKRYLQELRNNPEGVNLLREKAIEKNVTLLYGVKDTEQNHAVLLLEYLESL